MFVIELVKNEETIETMITQAIHLLIQVTNNYTMSYCYSQNVYDVPFVVMVTRDECHCQMRVYP